MGNDVLWLISGLALIVAELTTGTFYLLMLGVGALAGSAVAFYGLGFAVQSIVAGSVSVIMVFLFKHKFAKGKPEQQGENNIDVGQPGLTRRRGWRELNIAAPVGTRK